MYFKILMKGKSCNGGSYLWSLPVDGKPGEWSEKLHGRLRPCAFGYHVACDEQLLEWVTDPYQDVYVAEIKYRPCNEADDKVVARSVRLIRKIDITEDKFFLIIDEGMKYLNSIKCVSTFTNEHYHYLTTRKIHWSMSEACRLFRSARYTFSHVEAQFIFCEGYDIIKKHLDIGE